MSNKYPSCCLKSCTVPLIGLILLVGAGLIITALMIPPRAEKVFGPPAPWLNFRQQLTYGTFLLLNQKDLTRPQLSKGDEITFFIEFGESIPSIVGRLQENGLINDPGAFRTFLQYSGLDTAIQAGEHTIRPDMTPIEIARGLEDAIPTHVSFVIIPGWRMEEIGAALPTSGLTFDTADFLELASNPSDDLVVLLDLPDEAALEGFLLPDTYHLPREISVEEFALILINNFSLQVTQEIRQGFEHQGLSLYGGTILASIVEREAVLEEEKPLIASVFLNRLKAGMPLASDPTVQYALGYNEEQQTWWTNPLSLQDLGIDSPFNTYLYGGLPPGPISNPGKTSLRAVAFPAQTPYLYFRASCDNSGRHVFSESFEEHLNNACPEP